MIQTEIEKLDKIVIEAITRAEETQFPQLISITDTIDAVDPFIFFDQAKYINGDRTFWASTAEDFFLVGAGKAYTLKANADRFNQMELQWNHIISNAFIYNPYQVPGTGPIAIGGFSFDPKKTKTNLWNKFQNSQFQIPAYLLTKIDGNYYLTSNVIVYPEDHPKQIQFEIRENQQILLENKIGLPDCPTIIEQNEILPNEWKNLVSKATKEIEKEQIDKIVLARELRVTFQKKANIAPILFQLASTQTNSYVFAFENDEDCFLGATPERLVKLQDHQLLSTCLAGTAPRGKTEQEDMEIGNQLLYDVKNRQEHQFVVEMIKDAVAACSNNVDVPSEPILYPLKHLQHLYTPVKATLKDEYSIFDVINRLHPTPALGGFPKEKSLTFIREYEALDRGWYGAPIGWLDAYRNGEFAVAIRSALIQGRQASLFAGCGVVKNSDPEAEYQETNIKFKPMLSVLGG